MNSVDWLAYFITVYLSCMPVPATSLEGPYQVSEWACRGKQGDITVLGYRKRCEGSQGPYWGNLFYLSLPGGLAVASDQFGGFRIGQGMTKDMAYEVRCE